MPEIVSTEPTSTYGDPRKNMAAYMAFLRENDPELARIAQAWPTLPAAVKVGILAMIRATVG